MQSSYQKINGTYKLHKCEIERESEYVISNYDISILDKPQPTPIELIIENEGLNLRYKRLSKDLSILGAMVFNRGAVIIYENDDYVLREFNSKDIIIEEELVNSGDKRLKFTYAHELGHYITQYSIEHIDENQLSFDLFDDSKMIASICKREMISEDNLSCNKKELKTKVDWQEWQANYFASCILIPKKTLDIYLRPYFKDFDVMNPEKPLTKLTNIELDKLVKEISKIYDVSQEMTLNRLKSLEYV